MVLLFHCHIHHENSFGALTGFVSMGAVFMTAFFMLSGYVLFLTYKDKSLVQAPALKNFYLKRIFGIFPLYLVVAALYVVTLGQESVFQNLVLLPIEVLGLQSVFSTLFPVSHNDGTWFISCLLLAYFLFATCVFGVPADAGNRKADVDAYEVDGACDLHSYSALVAACRAYVQDGFDLCKPVFPRTGIFHWCAFVLVADPRGNRESPCDVESLCR